ncbi:MerR family transcriptional regulator [Slackia piriformis]|uniref:MerR family transcriptional regulator n=1 Tax=Slackia piriformis TaxID=626934 RepID=UPI0032C1CB60
MESLFKTGEFAELCQTTKNTLIHYDHVGVLKPTEVGENGYRYYRPNDLFRFKTVRALTDAGFTLQEVRSVFSEYDSDTLGRSVAEHRAELRAHIDRLAHAASLLDEIDRQISSNREAEPGAFFLEERPDRLIINLDCPVDSMWLKGADAALSDGKAMETLERISPEASLSLYGLKAYDALERGRICYDGGFYLLPESVTFEEVVRLLRSESHLCDESQLETVPAGTYACISEVGPQKKAAAVHARLLEEVGRRGLRPCGPRYEVISFRLSDVAPGRVYRFVVSVRCEPADA